MRISYLIYMIWLGSTRILNCQNHDMEIYSTQVLSAITSNPRSIWMDQRFFLSSYNPFWASRIGKGSWKSVRFCDYNTANVISPPLTLSTLLSTDAAFLTPLLFASTPIPLSHPSSTVSAYPHLLTLFPYYLLLVLLLLLSLDSASCILPAYNNCAPPSHPPYHSLALEFPCPVLKPHMSTVW